MPDDNAPNTLGKSYSITAEVEIPPGGAEGMLNTLGGRFGGYGLYLVKGKPVFTYVQLTTEHFRWEGPAALTAGKHTIMFDFNYDGPGFGKGGTGVLSVDGKEVASKTMPYTIPFLVTVDEIFDVGVDTRTAVDDNDYQVPFRFTGKLNKLTIRLVPSEFGGGEAAPARDPGYQKQGAVIPAVVHEARAGRFLSTLNRRDGAAQLDRPVPAHPGGGGGPPAGALVLDGEAVCCDPDGTANFEKLHSQAHNDRVFLYAFDLLELGGIDLRVEPLEERRGRLQHLMQKVTHPGVQYQRAHRRGRARRSSSTPASWGSRASSRSTGSTPTDQGRASRG